MENNIPDNNIHDIEAELYIDGFTNQGAGVGRLQGMAVFVPGALPGETVRARLISRKKNFAQAKLLAILEPSPHRVAADCPLYGRCGGCMLQHADYQEQLKLKQGLVSAALSRIGGCGVEVRPTIGSPEQLGYRSRMAYHVLHIKDRIELGFFMFNSKVFVPATVCMLPVQPIRALAKRLPALLGNTLPGLRDVVIRCNRQGKLLMTLVGDKAANGEALAEKLMSAVPELVSVWECSGKPVYGIYGDKWRLLAGDELFVDEVAGVKMELAPAAFTQVNPPQTAELYRLAAEAASLAKDMELLDLYSGAGAISLYMADKVKQVTAVESYAPAVEDAKRNALLNHATNCRFLTGETEVILPRLAHEGLRTDVAVLDPPRAGCAKVALEALAKIAPERIVYISCDPATLARDLRLLCDNGYKAEFAQPVDMFPQTSHVETVVKLSKYGK